MDTTVASGDLGRERELFEAALELEPAAREAFLREECPDEELRRHVHRLIQVHERASPELLDPVPLAPERIGPYVLGPLLGQGGMGAVYEAWQESPVRRRVALKLIRPGMGSRQVLARFESERQALAMMSHGNVSRVFDAGVAADGRPFFVMEFVDGVPITEFCDRRVLGIRERLALFRHVCDGVQHAHRKGIIHRDIKPSNVLVQVENDRAVPKIIDFGIAKAAGEGAGRMLTVEGQMVGTPEYMSPEQAGTAVLDVDTRSDVYSLGVLLYELLVGELPFALTAERPDALLELQRRILETDPVRPSQRVRARGEPNRRVGVSTLSRQLRGDLDCIVLKALEKDRNRRYSSPAELADDVGRYLRSEAVHASAPSRTYRLRKFVRRHRAGVAAAAIASLALVAGVVGLGVGIVRSGRAEAAALAEAETAERVVGFLVDMFTEAKPGEARDGSTTAREILALGAERLERDDAIRPLVRARLLHTVGAVSSALGLYESAEALLEEARTIRTAELGSDDPLVGETLAALGWLRRSQARNREALELHRQAEDVAEAHADAAGLEDALRGQAMAKVRMGESAEAVRLLRRALEVAEANHGVEDPRVAHVLGDLGLALQYLGRYGEAEEHYLRALGILERNHGPDHYELAPTLTGLGILYATERRLDEAEAFFRRALTVRESVLGPDNPDLAVILGNLGNVLKDKGSNEEAEPLLRRVLVIREKTLGPDHPDTAAALSALGNLLRVQGDLDTAQELLERGLEVRLAALGPRHPFVAGDYRSLARVARSQGRIDDAEQLFRRALETRQEGDGPEHPKVASILVDLAELYRRTGRPADAAPLYARAMEILEGAGQVESMDYKAAEWGLEHVQPEGAEAP